MRCTARTHGLPRTAKVGKVFLSYHPACGAKLLAGPQQAGLSSEMDFHCQELFGDSPVEWEPYRVYFPPLCFSMAKRL